MNGKAKVHPTVHDIKYETSTRTCDFFAVPEFSCSFLRNIFGLFFYQQRNNYGFFATLGCVSFFLSRDKQEKISFSSSKHCFKLALCGREYEELPQMCSSQRFLSLFCTINKSYYCHNTIFYLLHRKNHNFVLKPTGFST